MLYKTNPNKEDTDGDDFIDSDEILQGTSPTNSEDYPESHILSYLLITFGTLILGAGIVILVVKGGTTPPTQIKVAPMPKITAPKTAVKVKPKPFLSAIKPLTKADYLKNVSTIASKHRATISRRIHRGGK